MRSVCSTSVVTSLLLLGLSGACAVSEDGSSVIVPPPEEVDTDDTPDPDSEIEFEVGDDVEALSALAPAASRHVYGTSVRGQSLVYFKITPPAPNGKQAFLTFALHGFEDAWKQDGRALFSIAHKAIDYYGNDPSQLNGWTLYIVPTGNPDGMRLGTNNWRDRRRVRPLYLGRQGPQPPRVERHVHGAAQAHGAVRPGEADVATTFTAGTTRITATAGSAGSSSDRSTPRTTASPNTASSIRPAR
jgi:hypothetical protein